MKLLALALALLVAAATSASAIDLAGMDRQVRPQDDLYLAANGGWLRATPLPPDRAEVYGADLPARVDARVRDIVRELAARPQPQGSPAQHIAVFYRAHLDTAAIDRAGLAPVQPLLREIAGLQSVGDVARWQGRAQGWLQTPIWLWGGFADFQDPSLNRVLGWQGGLGLPDRDFYGASAGADMLKARAAYLAYLTELARLAGMGDAGATAARVLALETRLAQGQVSAQESRDPARMYHPLTAA